MPFDCKPYLSKCCGRCCGVHPLLKDTVERNRDKIVRDVKEEIPVTIPQGKYSGEHIILNTAEMVCAFLNDDYSCNIYEDRDPVCRAFGDDEKVFIRCPHQFRDGTPK